MVKPKITILKLKFLDEEGHYRFFNIKQMQNTFALDPQNRFNTSTGREYPLILNKYGGMIATEKQLLEIIYKNFGSGIYRIIAHGKGRKGTWTFWKGELNEEGYYFYEKDNTSKELKSLYKELEKAKLNNNDEDIRLLEDDIEFMKREDSEEIKNIRYGFVPFIKRSGKRGEKHYWEELDEGEQNYENEISY